MDVREKLVELIKDGIRKGLRAKGDDRLDYSFEDVADYLIANGVTVQEWISCEDRLPTQEDAPTEYVFTAYKNENCYDVNISLWDIVVGYPDLYDYWMPLPMPQPPKGE